MEKFFSDKPRPLGQVVKSIFLAYIHIYKPIFVLLVAFSLLHVGDSFIRGMSWPILTAVFVVLLLLGVFLYTAMLKIGNEVLYGEPYGLYDVVKLARDRLLMILAGVFLLVAIQAVIWLVSYGISFLGVQFYALTIALIVLVSFAFYVMVLVYFVLPLIALEDMNPFAALRKSVGLVYGHWWICFSLIGGMFLMMSLLGTVGVVTQFADHEFFVHLADFLMLMIMTPLYIGLTLVLLHELEMHKLVAEGKTVVTAPQEKAPETPAAPQAEDEDKDKK